jgi:hypothetical protein
MRPHIEYNPIHIRATLGILGMHASQFARPDVANSCMGHLIFSEPSELNRQGNSHNC